VKKVGNHVVAIKETTRKCKGYNKMRVRAEVNAMASLNSNDGNPYLIRYYSSWVENEVFYLEVI
jgi:hypothetical protein